MTNELPVDRLREKSMQMSLPADVMEAFQLTRWQSVGYDDGSIYDPGES